MECNTKEILTITLTTATRNTKSQQLKHQKKKSHETYIYLQIHDLLK